MLIRQKHRMVKRALQLTESSCIHFTKLMSKDRERVSEQTGGVGANGKKLGEKKQPDLKYRNSEYILAKCVASSLLFFKVVSWITLKIILSILIIIQNYSKKPTTYSQVGGLRMMIKLEYSFSINSKFFASVFKGQWEGQDHIF